MSQNNEDTLSNKSHYIKLTAEEWESIKELSEKLHQRLGFKPTAKDTVLHAIQTARATV